MLEQIDEGANAGAAVTEQPQNPTPVLEGEAETAATPGTSYHDRLAALEKHFADLLNTLETDFTKVPTVIARYGAHLKTLVSAGIHSAEDYIDTKFHTHLVSSAASSQDESVPEPTTPVPTAEEAAEHPTTAEPADVDTDAGTLPVDEVPQIQGSTESNA